jgi:hypothetical protein
MGGSFSTIARGGETVSVSVVVTWDVVRTSPTFRPARTSKTRAIQRYLREFIAWT